MMDQGHILASNDPLHRPLLEMLRAKKITASSAAS